MDYAHALGLHQVIDDACEESEKLQIYINLKLASSGQPTCISHETAGFFEISRDLVKSYREKNRLLSNYQCRVDQRIQTFLRQYLGDDMEEDQVPRLPTQTFILDRHGVARELSLPMNEDEFHSEIVSSYRVKQGVLHNPVNDRRTSQGFFHITEGGLPVPGDKTAVPKRTFARLLEHALNPPAELLTVPFTAGLPEPARMFVSLLLRPIVCPEIPGLEAEKTMEIRFFAPGSLVSNLDFVESIFGNGGNPHLAESDAALDVDHWTGHTGCVILAPHLVALTKRELGLPRWDEATERQRRDGMCWKQSDERYNNGQAFKLTTRDETGVIVTLLADNYFGYCKKEVKAQISFSANLFGLAEEEHAGGALAFPCRNHGEEYGADRRAHAPGYSFEEVRERYGEIMELQPEGYGIDKHYPEILYVPQKLHMDLIAQTVSWEMNGELQTIRLRPDRIYLQPNGYKLEMQKHPDAPSWRLIGTDPEGTFCHKPCTVSGGGKSEISKSLDDAVIYRPLFVDDLNRDLDMVQGIFTRDYTRRFKPGFEDDDHDASRPPLSTGRSLGSVIKLLTPSPKYTDEFNAWLESIPPRILALTYLIKRFYRPQWGNRWREHLSVDVVDGAPAHELKLRDRTIIASYLRVGFDRESKWRTFKLRQDFIAAEKVQMEDDISASVVVPAGCLSGCGPAARRGDYSAKLVKNCEYRLFQRPDEAIHPGFDKQTEADLAGSGNFIANYEPIYGERLTALVEDVNTFYRFTPPMQGVLKEVYEEGRGYVVSSAHPRLVDGKPSRNPRYLQTRPDLVQPRRTYIAEIGMRLHRKLGLQEPICHPVDAVLIGRRNNPPEPGIRSLAVYNPIHYQELPELFMDFICSLTGKSPSTTGAGSEGALTKGPFNALRATADLNGALVSFILTGYAGFSSSAGYVGPDMRVDHDISLLVPEIWARLSSEQRDPAYLISNGYLEALQDIEYQGRTVFASRLGYRITGHFVHDFMGKIFDNPGAVFTEEILKPETQGMEIYVDGIDNIVEAQQRVARRYLDGGCIEDACPPLQALLHIMGTGNYRGMDVHHPDIRAMFTREYLLDSRWYHERLEVKQRRDVALWKRHLQNLHRFLNDVEYSDEAQRLGIGRRYETARKKLIQVQSREYLTSLVGTIGADPLRPVSCEVLQQVRGGVRVVA
jgi:phosphoenolpyruvate carboxykinase (diphosphate)